MSQGIVSVENDVSMIRNNNLLDNWYFKDPVNQREVSGTINSKGYFIDRWILSDGEVTLTDEGLILNGTIQQKLEWAVGDRYIASALTTNGMIDAEYDNENKIFTITASGECLIAAKLEISDYQTLAHQESDGSWMLNDSPPNKDTEETRCKRYYIHSLLVGGVGMADTSSSGHYYLNPNIHMRLQHPTFTYLGSCSMFAGKGWTAVPSTLNWHYADDQMEAYLTGGAAQSTGVIGCCCILLRFDAEL